jgi:hypothetical protein
MDNRVVTGLSFVSNPGLGATSKLGKRYQAPPRIVKTDRIHHVNNDNILLFDFASLVPGIGLPANLFLCRVFYRRKTLGIISYIAYHAVADPSGR